MTITGRACLARLASLVICGAAHSTVPSYGSDESNNTDHADDIADGT